MAFPEIEDLHKRLIFAEMNNAPRKGDSIRKLAVDLRVALEADEHMAQKVIREKNERLQTRNALLARQLEEMEADNRNLRARLYGMTHPMEVVRAWKPARSWVRSLWSFLLARKYSA